MGLQQIAIIVLYTVSFGIMLAEHGKPKRGKENAWISLLSLIIIFSLLISGGFFK